MNFHFERECNCYSELSRHGNDINDSMFHPIRNYEEKNDMLPVFSPFLSKNCKIISVLFTAFFNNKKNTAEQIKSQNTTTQLKKNLQLKKHCIVSPQGITFFYIRTFYCALNH